MKRTNLPKKPGTYYYYSSVDEVVYAFYIFGDGSHGALKWEENLTFRTTPKEAELDRTKDKHESC